MQNEMRHARKRPAQFLDDRTPVMPASGIGHAVGGDQHLRFDLLEAIDDGRRPHVGGADAPDRTDARGGEEGDDGLGDVGEVGGDTIAGADALRP
jgi:hypothetical protein